MSEGAIEPYFAKTNKEGEDAHTSYWTSVIRSLIWKEGGEVKDVDFIFDPDGLAQTLINIAVKFEKDKYKASIRPQFTKEVNLAIKELLVSLRKMKVPDLWQNIAKNVKACFIETRLA